LRRILNVLTDEAVRQFSGRQFQSLGAATEKRRAAVSKLCGGTDRNFCVDECVEVWMTSCMYSETLRLGCMLLYHMTVLHNSIHTFARKQCLKCKFWAQKLYVVWGSLEALITWSQPTRTQSGNLVMHMTQWIYWALFDFLTRDRKQRSVKK